MGLLEKIRADALAARKVKAPEAGGLVTLIGEIDTKTKTLNPARDLTDAEILAIVKKFLKGIDEIIALGAGTPDSRILAEKAVLEGYLPAQMTEADLHAFALEKVAEGLNIGQIMGALKAEHAGCYDGRLASGIVKAALAA